MSDDLDQLIRQAASAHLALAPASVLTTPGVSGVEDDNDLIARAMRRAEDPAYLAQLAPFDPEAVMMSEPDPDDDDLPAKPTGAAGAPTDDSGLHDIRALAQTAKHRISRKLPTVSEADDGMWASTTGQLKAIALPEPARLVSLPDLPSSADADLARATAAKIEARGAALATAAPEVTSIDSVRPRKRTALWLGVGGVALAAAVIVVVASGGSGTTSDQRVAGAATDTVAAGVAAGPTTTAPSIEGPSMAAAAPGTATEAARPEGAVATGGAGDVPAAPRVEDRGPAASAAGSGSDKRDDAGSAKDQRGSGDGEPKSGRGGAAGAGSGSAPAKEIVKATDAKGTGDKATGDGKKPGAGAGSGSAAPTGEKSIDDLLGDATGGGPKPPPGGGDSKPKTDKTGLDGKDIKAGMAPLAGKAQGCYDANGVAGHVKVKAIVDPSGKVTKVDAVGEFAGTPTGTCVAGVVKAGASFPAWDGAPMTVNYSYTLNE